MHKIKHNFWLLTLIALLWPVASILAQDATPVPIEAGPTLRAAQARGQLVCGVNEEVFGFGFLNPNTGELTGLYVDLCRALAAAVIGEAEAVDFRLHLLGTPPGDVIAGDLDVLFSHNLPPTLSRTSRAGLVVSPAALFYDGATLMVQDNGNIVDWPDLDGETICTQDDSQSAADFAAEMEQRDLTYDEDSFPTIDGMKATFFEGRCSALVLERSLLEIVRHSSNSPQAFIVWPDPFTRQPIVPLYRYGDEQWAALVDWTLWGIIQAEQAGITSQTIDRFLRVEGESEQAYIRRVGVTVALMLDPGLGLGGKLGLPNDFMADVIRQVGNYGEIYDRNFGPTSTLPIERGLNASWRDGGLIYAPAWR